MSQDALEQHYLSYLQAYGDIAPAERERLLRESVSDDVQSVNPNGESRGFGNLVKHIEQFQTQRPGAYFKSNKLLAHHGQFLSEWTMYDKSGAPIATAHTCGRFDEQGFITYLIGFF